MGQDGAILKVRPAASADAGGLATLVRGLLDYEGKRQAAHVTPETVAGWLNGPDPVFEALVATLDEALVGYLAFYRAFSLFKGGPVFLVETLYVADAARGLGAGRALMAAAAREAQRRGFVRMELHVSDDNAAAKAFYQAIGLNAPGEAVLRIEDTALERLALHAKD